MNEAIHRGNIPINDRLKEIEISICEKARSSSPSLISREGFIHIFIALFLFLIAQSSNKSDIESLSSKMETFLQEIKTITPSSNDKGVYIINRAAILQEEKGTKKESPVIAILYPNQKVEVIERKGKWRKVEYFNYLDGELQTGWIRKKYLKLVK